MLLWHNCRHLILELFRVTSIFPEQELNGLANQIRTTCVAITSNIGMAFKMNNELKKSEFFNLAISSAESLRVNLMEAKQKNLLSGASFEHFAKKVDEIKKVLFRCISRQESGISV